MHSTMKTEDTEALGR